MGVVIVVVEEVEAVVIGVCKVGLEVTAGCLEFPAPGLFRKTLYGVNSLTDSVTSNSEPS